VVVEGVVVVAAVVAVVEDTPPSTASLSGNVDEKRGRLGLRREKAAPLLLLLVARLVSRLLWI